MSPRLAMLGLVLLAAGCATPRDRVVLLGGADGRSGSVAVLSPQSGVVLTRANESAEIDALGRVRFAAAPVEPDSSRYADTLGALPARPVLYMLYFETDSDQLTPESKAEAPLMLREVAARPAAEVVVIGHTDRYGALDHNDRLSLARAEAVRRQLIELGFDPASLSVEGRGEREPLVPTADEVRESNNRRAEVNVR